MRCEEEQEGNGREGKRCKVPGLGEGDLALSRPKARLSQTANSRASHGTNCDSGTITGAAMSQQGA